MRVISGTAKGRKLKSVPGEGTRPVTDRVKESLFNILGTDVRDARFLDLFAGTGSVGIEALSRGAAEAVFVEQSRAALETIRANLAATKLADRAHVVRANVFSFLAGTPDAPFDYIYIAPPQYKSLWAQTLRAMDANPAWLSDDAQVIVQIHPREFEELSLKHLALVDERKYGSTVLCFYELESP
jgi:16S rRNA (guanine(966)-N(2))-methyltransferase RsmD